ncbi:13801_t:CDS:2, partial [Cetraspora pellucida]
NKDEDEDKDEDENKDKNENEDNDEQNIKQNSSISAFLQEVSQNIINQCVILASITQDTKFDKIEINPTKKIAILKNNRDEIILKPINSVEIWKSSINIKFSKLERISRKQFNQDPYPIIGYFANFQLTKKKDILTDDYYKGLLKYLKELSILRKTLIVQFDPIQIN